jgi:hypothetical protein
MLGVLAFFDWVLVTQLQQGAESCGCFGATITVDPRIMLAIDSLLFLAILASKPWRIENRGAPIWVVGLAVLMGLIAPWALIPKAGPPVAVTSGGNTPENGTPQAPETGGRYVEPEPDKWIGQMIWDIPDIVNLIDATILPSDGRIVLWRSDCDHCAAHLKTMFEQDDGTVPIVLLQIQDEKGDPVVVIMPEGAHVAHAQFPKGLEFVLQTPWELVVEAGIVTQAIGPDDLEEGDEH